MMATGLRRIGIHPPGWVWHRLGGWVAVAIAWLSPSAFGSGSAGLAASGLPPAVAPLAAGANRALAWGGYGWYQRSEDGNRAAKAILDRYLARLKAAGMDPNAQGIWLQAGRRLVASHQGLTARSAASLTKLGTSLAALETWGSQHQFATEFATDGTVVGDTVRGNLLVMGGGDPFFVWEEAIAVGNALNQLGVRRVTGNLVVVGDFSMNFLPDPQQPKQFPPSQSGELLRQGLDARRWPPQAAAQFATLPPGTARPQVEIAGSVVLQATATERRVGLLRRRSLPLVDILKQMNIYSNNAMAERLGQWVGGPRAVVAKLAQATGVPAAEMQPINGSGLDVANRWSPRAIAAILFRLGADLRVPLAQGRDPAPPAYSLADVLPVSGRDVGTLVDRTIPPGAAVKTGSLSVVSGLAGVLPTQQPGPLTFVIINGGSKLDVLRREQDRFLGELQAQFGRSPQLPDLLQPRSPHLGPDRAAELKAERYSQRPTGLPALGDPARSDRLWPGGAKSP